MRLKSHQEKFFQWEAFVANNYRNSQFCEEEKKSKRLTEERLSFLWEGNEEWEDIYEIKAIGWVNSREI